ncbi:hypothetical protein BJX63DRAFT_435283 [Aspergillus granulosus]|uniref:Uncharacterized protein n=1 Tax=Aspergillus granulosus TaxID=176169 RepID=A0ABR4H1I8_9EURO
MALLLTCLPNITAIDAHVPQSDPVLGSVLRHVLAEHNSRNAADGTGPVPLTHLASVRLWGEVFIETNLDLADGYGTSALLRLNTIWPLIFLPGLRTLGVYEVDINGVLEMLEGKGHANIQDLTVVCTSHSEATFKDFKAFIATMRGLRRFSFGFDDNYHNSDLGDNTVLPSRRTWGSAFPTSGDSTSTTSLALPISTARSITAAS